MVNEEKVILMTKLAAYEAREGKRDIRMLNFFRSDFIGFQLLKSIIAAAISFFAIFAVYVFYNFESLMQDIYDMDLVSYGRNVVILFLCLVGIYGVISYVVYANRYNKAKRKLRAYYTNLKKLSSMYDNK